MKTKTKWNKKMYEKNDDEEKEKKIDLQSINKPDDV